MGVIHDSYGRGIDELNPLNVKIAGADASGGAVNTTTNDILPFDKQAQLKQQIENNTTPLGISATYTGASFDTMADGVNYTWLTGTVFTDIAGTLSVQQSADGVFWNTFDSITVGASVPTKINVDVLTRYIRLVHVNGATAQTILRLYAYVTFK